jgi:carboxymethylenebutenolidase
MARQEIVRFRGGQEETGGLLVRPDGAGPFPAVILTPAIAGLNDYIERVARRIALRGVACLALDYYADVGSAPDLSDMSKILAAVAALPDPRVLADMDAAVAHLRDQPDVDGERIGALGFCIGGSYSLMAASHIGRLRCAISFYGQLRYQELSDNKPISPIDTVDELGCPLLGHFGEADHLVSIEHVMELQKRVQGKAAEIYTYPGAGHAFHEDFRPPVYRPVAATTAWDRTVTYLDWYLRDGQPAG